MTTSKDPDKSLDDAKREFEARQATRDRDSTYIKEAIFGNPTSAIAAGDQAKSAAKEEQAIRQETRPPRHRK